MINERMLSEDNDIAPRKPRSIDLAVTRETSLALALIGLFGALAYFTTQAAPAAAVYNGVLGFSMLILFALLERVFPSAGPRKPFKRWLLHFQIILVNSIAATLIFLLIGKELMPYTAKWLGVNIGIFDFRLSSYGVIGVIISSTLGLVIADFFFYWLHRAMHKSRILWQHHKLHHMDPEFDVLTSGRTNWFENVLYVFFYSLPPAILFKFDDASIATAGMVNGIILYIVGITRLINHSSLRMQFGRASVIWISSQTHRIHHSILPQHFDKNFCGYLPLWDILFGTYYHPKKDEFPPTGVPDEREIRSLWEVQIFTVREWWRMFRKWRANRNSASI